MKFLRLFSSGTSGTSGTSQQLQEVNPVPPQVVPVVPVVPKTDNPQSGTTGTTPENMSGTAQLVENTEMYHWYHSYHYKTPEKVFNVSLATLEYAATQLVACPQSGAKVHLWACSRCPHSATCKAMTGRDDTLKDWLLYDMPHSLGLTEGLFEVEPDNPLSPMVEACPDFYRGCFSCRHCDFSKPAFCGKYTRAGRMLS